MAETHLYLVRQRSSLVRAAVAFLKQWERQGNTGVSEAKQALLRVFQMPPDLLDRAITIWSDRWSDGRRSMTPSIRTLKRRRDDLLWQSLYRVSA